MTKMWNFHGYIALPLEEYGRKYIGSSAMAADEIENGGFIDAMLQILTIKYNDFGDFSDFAERCKQYESLTESEKKNNTEKELFEDFKKLIQ